MTSRKEPPRSARAAHQPERPTGRRRSDRVFLALPIEVTGTDLSGRDFSQKASTKQLARYGGSLTIDAALGPEQSFTIRLLGGRPQDVRVREAEIRIIGQLGIEAGGNVYGFAFQGHPKSGFWGIHFPVFSEQEEQDFLTKVVLECGGCSRREIVALNEVEFDVFEASDRLTFHCKNCKQSTIWKKATFERVAAPPTLAGPLTSEQMVPAATDAPPPAWPAVNLRRAPRVKVSLKGCILIAGDEHPVSVLDVSRSGIRFHVQKRFGVDQWVQVAVPYIVAGANIFRPGRIVWRKERGVTGFEYGLKFVKD